MCLQQCQWNWIFDWSGTLVDDMALVICATNYVMRKYALPEWEREGFRRSFRLPYEEFYQEHLPQVGLDEIERLFREGFAVSEKTVPILPHAHAFLSFLKERQSKMFVLTSMCATAFSEQLEELKLGHFFDKTYAGVLDKRELIGELLRENQLDPKRTIFVGDMTHDIETAHHGGTHSIGVLTGYNHREVLEATQPSLLMDDLRALQDLLETTADWATLL